MTGIGLVVPLFDEEDRFPEFGKLLVDFIIDQPDGSELVFVDDGSTDGTPALVEELIASVPGRPVRLLRRPHQGKGAAVSAGLQSCSAPYVGFCDLDLSTPLDQFQLVIDTARRAPVLAVGSRDLAASRLLRTEGRVREALGRTYNRFLQATITPGVVDTQCGAKAAAREVWQALLPFCSQQGYAWDAEVIAVARALGIGVQEVAIEWRHDERSKVNVLRDGMAMVATTPQIWRSARRAATTRQGAASPRTSDEIRPAGQVGEVFDDDNAALLMGADADHWWFRGKAALVSTALRRCVSEPGRGWLVDAGAGAGGVTAMLGWRADRLVVVEGNQALVSHAHRRHGLHGIRATVDRLPLDDGSAQVVCLLDVIEHVGDPVSALREAARVLAPEGRLVVNVPAHQWLWSAADEALGHVCRYDRRKLRGELADAGFEAEIMTHVFSWLVLPVWLKRRLASGGEAELGLDQTSPAIDLAAMVLTRLERALIGRLSVPVGTSLLCVAKRRSD